MRAAVLYTARRWFESTLPYHHRDAARDGRDASRSGGGGPPDELSHTPQEAPVVTAVSRPLRPTAMIIAATAIGVAIAAIDSRPGYDATGVTAGLLVVTAAAFSAVAGSRPWLWAILVGIWTPLLEIPAGGGPAPAAALAIAAVGALVGLTARRVVEAE